MQQQIDVEVGLKCNLCAGTQVRVLYVNQLHFHPIVFGKKVLDRLPPCCRTEIWSTKNDIT